MSIDPATADTAASDAAAPPTVDATIPVTTPTTIPVDDGNTISDADAVVLEGRSRVTLPPRTSDPAEAVAAQNGTDADAASFPTYEEMRHLLPD